MAAKVCIHICASAKPSLKQAANSQENTEASERLLMCLQSQLTFSIGSFSVFAHGYLCFANVAVLDWLERAKFVPTTGHSRSCGLPGWTLDICTMVVASDRLPFGHLNLWNLQEATAQGCGC
jgi:hypothetical protein